MESAQATQTNMVMSLSQIISLSQACHNMECSLGTHEAQFLSENPVVLPAGG